MREGPPIQENIDNERTLADAEYVINLMWEKVMSVTDLPLSVDPSYQAWSQDLKRRKNDFARVLFSKAREATGEEKLRAAQTLKRLMKLLDRVSKQEILTGLMTTEEALRELVNQGEGEVKSKQTRPKRAKTKFRKVMDRLLRRDDDFDDNI